MLKNQVLRPAGAKSINEMETKEDESSEKKRNTLSRVHGQNSLLSILTCLLACCCCIALARALILRPFFRFPFDPERGPCRHFACHISAYSYRSTPTERSFGAFVCVPTADWMPVRFTFFVRSSIVMKALLLPLDGPGP